MGQFSAFDPFGLFDFSAAPGPAEPAYRALVAQQQDLLNADPGTYVEAKAYASAIAIGCARATIRRGLNQRNPSKAHDRIPTLERDRGIVAPADASPDQRRAVLAAREALVHGSREEALTTDLRAVLGTRLVRLRATAAGERVVWPSFPSGVGAYPKADAPLTFGQILDPIVHMLVPVTVRFAVLGGGSPPKVGQQITIEPDNNLQAEAVTVAGLDYSATALPASLGGMPDLLTVTCSWPKDAGARFHSAFPILTSTQRELQVIVTTAAARDPETRRQVHEVMARHCKTSTRWQIIETANNTTTGPWVVAVARVGATAVGSLSFAF